MYDILGGDGQSSPEDGGGGGSKIGGNEVCKNMESVARIFWLN